MKNRNWNNTPDRLLDPPECADGPECPDCGGATDVTGEGRYSLTYSCVECGLETHDEDNREPDDDLGAYDPPTPDLYDGTGRF